MPGDHSRDVTARLTELEATVRGLTQELVSANERIRQLEAALEEPSDSGAETADGDAGEDDRATKTTPVETQGTAESTSGDDEGVESGTDPDDIIVA